MKMIGKVSKKRRVGTTVLIILVLLGAPGMYFFKIKGHRSEQPNIQARFNEGVSMEVYNQFKALYEEEKDHLQTITTELYNADFSKEKEYLIIIGGQNGTGKYISEIIELYFEKSEISSEKLKELVNALNENEVLIEELIAIKQSGIVDQISVGNGEIAYAVNTDFTPFICTNNGITNYWVYSTTNDDLKKYGYKEMGDNWCMYIPDRPE